MPDPISSPPAAGPASAEGPATRCVRCGYSLAGLRSATCPECGFPVGGSTLLRYADPLWLRTLVTSTTLMRGGAIVALVLHFAPSAVGGVISRVGVPLGNSPKVVIRATEFAALAVAAAGAWLLAAPDPAMLSDEDDREARRRLVFRLGLVACFALAVARAALAPWLAPLAGAAITLAACIIGFKVLKGLGDVVRALVARCAIADQGVAKKAGSTGWLAVVLACFISIGALAALPLLFGSSGASVAKVGRALGTGESLLVFLGLMGGAFTLLSLAKPLKAVRGELELARHRTRPPEGS